MRSRRSGVLFLLTADSLAGVPPNHPQPLRHFAMRRLFPRDCARYCTAHGGLKRRRTLQ